MSLRVLMASAFPHDPEHVSGGVEAVAANLAPALAARLGIELHIAAFNPAVRRPYDELRNRIHFHWLPTQPRLSTARMLSADAVRLARLIRQLRPDLLHAQGASPLPVAALGSRHALVTTVHGLEMFSARMRGAQVYAGPVGRIRRTLSVLLMEIAFRRSNAIIAISPYVENVLRSRVPVARSVLIENPVGTAFFRLPPEPCIGPKVLLTVGYLSELKDPIGIICAFSEVARRYPNWCLVLVGGAAESSYRERVYQVIHSLDIDSQVRLAGPALRNQVLEHYRQSAVLVLGSREETAPMAITQAMAASRPVVSTLVGGVPWLVRPGVTGELVRPGDAASMAAALEDMLADEPRRRLLGEHARNEALARFTPALVALRTARLYHQVVDSSRAPLTNLAGAHSRKGLADHR